MNASRERGSEDPGRGRGSEDAGGERGSEDRGGERGSEDRGAERGSEDRGRAGGPSGLPDPERPDHPLGVTQADPDGEGNQPRGPEAMPGIPSRDEPPTAG